MRKKFRHLNVGQGVESQETFTGADAKSGTTNCYKQGATGGGGLLSSERILLKWDAVKDCIGKECAAVSSCSYVQKGKCSTMRAYMKGVSRAIYNDYEGILNDKELMHIGLHLLPLYKILCQMKIEEMGVHRIVTTTEHGTMVANPIYREIRETMKLINMEWKMIDLMAPTMGGIKFPHQQGRKAKMIDINKGDPEYYDTMTDPDFGKGQRRLLKKRL